jgi:hypothetical protein
VRYRELLEPDAATLELVAVSPLVNSVKNDDERCAAELPGPNSERLRAADKFPDALGWARLDWEHE